MPFQFTGHQIPGNDSTRFAIYQNEFLHFMTGIHRHISQGDLPFNCLVGTDKQLLAGLTCRIKCPLHLGSAETIDC